MILAALAALRKRLAPPLAPPRRAPYPGSQRAVYEGSLAVRLRSVHWWPMPAALLLLLVLAGRTASSGAAAPPKAQERPRGGTAVLHMKSRDDLKTPFNDGNGKVRIVAFLSPTCKYCIKNAAGLQEKVLDVIPGDDIAVHVVWLRVSEHDTAESIEPARKILHDERVRHYWDPARSLNMMLLDAIEFDVTVRLYDIFLLYGRDITWDKRLPRPGFWMHEFRGLPGPVFEPAAFALQVQKSLEGKSLDESKR